MKTLRFEHLTNPQICFRNIKLTLNARFRKHHTQKMCLEKKIQEYVFENQILLNMLVFEHLTLLQITIFETEQNQN